MIDWSKRKLQRREATDAVLLHHTEGSKTATVEAIDRYHLSLGWANGFAYHALIRLNPRSGVWQVQPGRPWWAVGAHAALTKKEEPAAGYTRGWWNYRALAIAVAGTYSDRSPPVEQVIDLVLGVCVDMRSQFGPLRILGHREAMAILGHPGHTVCPGTLSWVETVRERLPSMGPEGLGL